MTARRNTKQKRIILDALACADHPTAGELYSIVHESQPGISRGTVFRVLAQYAESGEILKLSDGESARFDARIQPHAHAICAKCGRIFDVFDSKISTVLSMALDGFEVHSANVEFSGICKNCK